MCEQNTNKPHKHAAVIKAWADGAIVEFRANSNEDWQPVSDRQDINPQWYPDYEYRVKPKIVRKYLYAYQLITCSPAVSVHHYRDDAEFIRFNYRDLEWFQRLDNSCVETEES